MLEIGVCIAGVVLMAKIADIERQSMVIWGVVTAGSCAAALFLLPWPFVRVIIAIALSFGALTVFKIIAKR
jgi:hypothetical protein